MPFTGVTIKRNASLAVPDAYLELAAKENPTAWGFAIVTPDGLITNSGDSTIDLEVVRDTFNDYNEQDFYLFLANSESAINMDDVSPHWLVEKDEVPLLVCFIEGKFPGFAKSGSSHPSEYHFLKDHVEPKINDLWELCDGNLDKLMGFIEKKKFGDELIAHANPRGYVTFVAANGKAFTHGTGEGAAEFKWGWASQNYGYGEDAPKAQPAKRSLFPQKTVSTVREKHVPPGTPVSPPTETATGASVIKNLGVRPERPRATDSRADRKTFCQRRIGYCPEGWDKKGADGQYPSINVYYDKLTNQTVFNNEIKKLGIDAVGLPPLNNPPRAGGKDVEPNNIHGNERPNGPAVTDAVLPIIPPKSREYAHDLLRKEDIKKLIAENGDPISDPKDAKGNEIKLEGFGQQLGMKDGLGDFARLPFSQYLKIAKEDASLMANLCWAFKNMAFANKRVTAEEKHELAHEELRPAKKSLFPQKKTA